MISTNNLTVQFGKRILFDDVNIKFTKGNCYGVIGANGAGKSTFLKVLSGEVDPTRGNVSLEAGKRMAVLSQDHFKYDDIPVLNTVIMGHEPLFKIMKEKEEIYAKEDFSDADGMRASELEEEFGEIGGWNSESDAGNLLSGLGVTEELHYSLMSELSGNQKVRVLIAQAIFGNPDLLIMDEPTNDLDVETISWLEDFLANFENTVIVVSHDRHFLDAVCTHIGDIDFGKLNLYSGNYSFWYESSQLALRQRSQQNKKTEEKRKELQNFIERFSANASKSKQATSRKKLLDKLNVDDIQPSSRKYPGIIFDQEREAGDQVLHVENLSQVVESKTLFSNFSINLNKGDKVALISKNSVAVSQLLQILAGEIPSQNSEIKWGITTKQSFLPNDNTEFFNKPYSLVDWLRQYTETEEEKDEVYIRGFLGKMLFSGDEPLKSCEVLSGGEKVRCMMSRMMLKRANVLLMDEPTSHLDLESITALNNALTEYKGSMIFTSHDHELTHTVANRIVEVGPFGMLDKLMSYDDYLNDEKIKEQRDAIYGKLKA
jgi:ATPase subunit of ABC transporter with duplicated ATPase domains